MAYFVEKKPPLGIMPKRVWIDIRALDLIAAIQRYRDAGKEIPVEWLTELKDHLTELYGTSLAERQEHG